MSSGNTPVTYHRLLLGNQWYIPVDDAGFTVGECAEGALGFIIKLYSRERDDHYSAMKIPRLMGDTHRENAYTNQLMENEQTAVGDVFHSFSMAREPLGALFRPDYTPLLRAPVAIKSGTDEERAWDGSIILVYFGKNQRP